MQESWPGSRPGQIVAPQMDEEDAAGPAGLAAAHRRKRLPPDAVGQLQYTFNRYVEAEDIRRGGYCKKDTIKQHALITEDLRIVAVIVTDGNAGDSPAPAELCAKAPRGSGHMLGDSAYCSRENCRLRLSGQGALLPAQEVFCAARHGRMGQDTGLVHGPPRHVLQDVWQTKHDRELLRRQGPVQFLDSDRDAGDATALDRRHTHLPEPLWRNRG